MNCDGDPLESTGQIEAGSWILSQRVSRVVLATALGLLGLWILHRFLPALAWATIIAIALWPLYRRAERAFPPRGHRILLRDGPLGAEANRYSPRRMPSSTPSALGGIW